MNRRICGIMVATLTLARASVPAASETMTFSNACKSGKRMTVAVAGDLLFHRKLQVQAYSKGSSFKRFFTPVKKVIQAADIAYGNLEGPAARGVAAGGRAVKDTGKRMGKVYGAPLRSLAFNYHPSVIPDLAASGFDSLSTANNHAMDRGPLGVDRTIEALRQYKMPFTGTRRRDEKPKMWSVVTKTGGMSIAWLACTYSTNGIPDRHGLVLYCYKQTDTILKEIKALRADPKIDAIFLTPHWRSENYHKPDNRQRKVGRAAIKASATAVFGAHPHVLQPWEKVTTDSGREGLIMYSLGNFVSNQRRTDERAGILGMVELIKTGKGKAKIAAAGYLPTWVVIDGKGHRVTFNTRAGGRPGEALRRTQGLLPYGNRMRAKTPLAFPSGCASSKYVAFNSLRADRRWVKHPRSAKSGSGQSKRSWNRIFKGSSSKRKRRRRRTDSTR